MTTSTEIVAQVASSTGQFVESFLPMIWLLIGLFLALTAASLIYRAVKGSINKGRRY